MTSSIFPDINLWLALTYEKHIHNEAAVQWYGSLEPLPRFVFCRHTQMGLFRLLSNEAVLKQDVFDQLGCWQVYDRWMGSGLAVFAEEPAGLEYAMRAQTSTPMRTAKAWADAFLAAFAETAGLTLVTFDKALAGKTNGAILLS